MVPRPLAWGGILILGAILLGLAVGPTDAWQQARPEADDRSSPRDLRFRLARMVDDDPSVELDAGTFLERTRSEVGGHVADLTARRNALRVELLQVEAELTRWQAIAEAIDPDAFSLPEADIEETLEATTEEPLEVEAPAEAIEAEPAAEATTEPADAAEPVEAAEPEEPVEVEQPVVEAVEVEQPAETETPVETEEPVETEQPVETEEPVETETPEEIETPEEAEEPGESGSESGEGDCSTSP